MNRQITKQQFSSLQGAVITQVSTEAYNDLWVVLSQNQTPIEILSEEDSRYWDLDLDLTKNS